MKNIVETFKITLSVFRLDDLKINFKIKNKIKQILFANFQTSFLGKKYHVLPD
jgi:hypothetical protein